MLQLRHHEEIVIYSKGLHPCRFPASRLGYFERRGRIMPFSKVLAEMGRYYAGQAIKQTFVLILGLDVIGNPFGVIRGVAQGVEDLFYEPVKVNSINR